MVFIVRARYVMQQAHERMNMCGRDRLPAPKGPVSGLPKAGVASPMPATLSPLLVFRI